jgi:hypothetical protein
MTEPCPFVRNEDNASRELCSEPELVWIPDQFLNQILQSSHLGVPVRGEHMAIPVFLFKIDNTNIVFSVSTPWLTNMPTMRL